MKILSDPNLPVDVPDYVKELIQSCWNECPEKRPDFSQIRTRLKKLNQGRSSNIMDKMIELMEFHTTHLEELGPIFKKILNDPLDSDLRQAETIITVV